MFDLKVSGITDVGRVRDHNEDAFLIDNPLLIVADGMGGAAAGEVASSIAIKTISEDLKNFSYANESEAVNLLKKAIRKADEEMKVQMEQDSSLSGMGTTLVLALRIDSRLLIGNVGDSRAYVISNPDSGKSKGTNTNFTGNAAAETGVMPKFDMDKPEKNAESIRRLTQDHSVVMEMVNSGVIEEKDIRTHPMRNRITRCLGSIGSSEPDFVWHDIAHGDTILLCSDGLWEMVHEDLILAIVNSSPDLEDACKRLITAANNSGGADNITAITARFENI
ncbi:PP2C family protein-serine/threonine phosphatase [Candidatus Latescibacterota bacterium]